MRRVFASPPMMSQKDEREARAPPRKDMDTLLLRVPTTTTQRSNPPHKRTPPQLPHKMPRIVVPRNLNTARDVRFKIQRLREDDGLRQAFHLECEHLLEHREKLRKKSVVILQATLGTPLTSRPHYPLRNGPQECSILRDRRLMLCDAEVEKRRQCFEEHKVDERKSATRSLRWMCALSLSLHYVRLMQRYHMHSKEKFGEFIPNVVGSARSINYA